MADGFFELDLPDGRNVYVTSNSNHGLYAEHKGDHTNSASERRRSRTQIATMGKWSKRIFAFTFQRRHFSLCLAQNNLTRIIPTVLN